jgi:A/G-specific adenine glycosylase
VDLTTLPGVGPYTAAAIRCFAFGEDVLPVDVNVERVRRRTGHVFSSASAHALMDLGATICIARAPRCDACPLAGDCPSRGVREAPARKQGPFEGSFRQRRAETLRLVAESTQSQQTLDDEAVRSLERDGLVVVVDGVVALP